ncbi:MAG: hypothetical protein JWM36_2618 [Hyphomicrobiales bacterium]|nr:hypothetical protein [Hyphomicrobiales bacterium]
MDDHDRFMCRQRAQRRAQQKGQKLDSLWGFENWDCDGREGHHISRKKYGDALIAIPVSMHRELTRRQLEEHATEGPDDSNPLERLGRFLLGLTDIVECLADFLRRVGNALIAAARRGQRKLCESDYSLTQLLAFMGALHKCLGATLATLAHEIGE